MNILSNETYTLHSNLSRYALVPIYYNKLDKRYLSGFPMRLSKDILSILHKVIPGDTLDSISLFYYGNPTYYWIIADYNDILDPFLPLTVGETLFVPTFSTIEFHEV